MSRRLPLVVILGATGSGKTKLSIELAQRFKGEVISADSMQVYKGLDIITAKATKEEQSLVPHHLLDIVEPDETFHVLQFRNSALKIIDNLLDRNKLPIVVGGTNYYIESLLWKILIDAPGEHVKAPPDTANKDYELPAEELHKKLKVLDPEMAKRLHPNNKRKILRALEVFHRKGRQLSEILSEQQKSKGASQSGGGLRYHNALIFRLQCEQAILDDRLNKRVDRMLEDGLVEELMNFHKMFNEQRHKPDYTKGVFQSIGFKEFHSYLTLSEEEKKSESGRKELEKCIDQLKMVTRRYARKQLKWTRNRFLGRIDREVPPMFGLDTSDVEKWSDNVSQPAMEIIESFMNETECRFKPLPMELSASNPNSEDDTYFCDVCERTFVGNYQWGQHLGSKRHKLKKQKKKLLVQ